MKAEVQKSSNLPDQRAVWYEQWSAVGRLRNYWSVVTKWQKSLDKYNQILKTNSFSVLCSYTKRYEKNTLKGLPYHSVKYFHLSDLSWKDRKRSNKVVYNCLVFLKPNSERSADWIENPRPMFNLKVQMHLRMRKQIAVAPATVAIVVARKYQH